MTRLLACFALLMVLAVQAIAAEEQRYFKDWLTSCRDDGYCSAMTYINPRDGLADHILRIGRQPGEGRLWEITLVPVNPLADVTVPIAMQVGGNGKLTFHPGEGYLAYLAVNDLYLVNEGLADRLLSDMAAGSQLTVFLRAENGDSERLSFSLSGPTAALLWIDEQQGRIDSPRRTARPQGLDVAPNMQGATALVDGGEGFKGLPARLVALHHAQSD